MWRDMLHTPFPLGHSSILLGTAADGKSVLEHFCDAVIAYAIAKIAAYSSRFQTHDVRHYKLGYKQVEEYYKKANDEEKAPKPTKKSQSARPTTPVTNRAPRNNKRRRAALAAIVEMEAEEEESAKASKNAETEHFRSLYARCQKKVQDAKDRRNGMFDKIQFIKVCNVCFSNKFTSF